MGGFAGRCQGSRSSLVASRQTPRPAKLSLPEAVSLAEKHHPGSKANQAELKFKKERLYYEVEVVTPKNEVFDVKVDAKDGTVFQSKPDNHD